MRYVPHSLNSQRVQSLIDSRGFQVLAPSSGQPSGSRVSYVTNLPAGRGHSNEYVSVFIQQVQLSAVSGPLNSFFISVLGCGKNDTCTSVRAGEERRAQNIVSQRMPLDGMGISAVYYGDANRDGLTDILVQFSNGAGTLYQAQLPLPLAGTPQPIQPIFRGRIFDE